MKSRFIYLEVLLFVIFTSILGSCLKSHQFDVMFRETEITISENESIVNVEFYLPDGSRNRDVEIDFRIGGTAVEGRDYTTAEPRFIVIPNGKTSASFNINLINNVGQDGVKTIVVAIILVIQNGNTIFQGATGQTLTIMLTDDDCSMYLAGTWEYTAQYTMYADSVTIQVGQDGKRLDDGANPVFTGELTIEDPGGNRGYIISDMLCGMFKDLEIETPSPLLDACGILSGPNDGSIFLMGALPANLTGRIESDSTIRLDFEYSDQEQTGGGAGFAHLLKK